MKKNLVIMFMAGFIVISGVGCSKHYEGEIIEGTYHSEIKSSLDLIKEDEDGIKVNKKILNADIFDNIIQIGEHIIEMPCSYEDISLIASPASEIPSYERVDENSVGEYVFYVNNDEDFDIDIGFKNSDEKYRHKPADLSATVISTDNTNVILSGGIRTGSSLKDVEKQYGEPKKAIKNTNDTIYLYYNDNIDNIEELLDNYPKLYMNRLIMIYINNETEKVESIVGCF